MQSKTKGNIAIAQAIYYFANNGYKIFLPVCDDGGKIDMIVSQNGTTLYRIQCKYTERLHNSMHSKYPERKIYCIDLRQIEKHYNPKGINRTIMKYTEESFDFLFITTPSDSYLLDWKTICHNKSHPPTTLCFGKKLSSSKVL